MDAISLELGGVVYQARRPAVKDFDLRRGQTLVNLLVGYVGKVADLDARLAQATEETLDGVLEEYYSVERVALLLSRELDARVGRFLEACAPELSAVYTALDEEARGRNAMLLFQQLATALRLSEAHLKN